MPMLDLGAFETLEDRYVAGHRLMAVMAWPSRGDEHVRNEYLSAIAADSLGRGGARPFEKLLEMTGGLRRVASARSLDQMNSNLISMYREWVETYLVIRAMLDIPNIEGATPRDVSLRRASEIASGGRERWTSEHHAIVVQKDSGRIRKRFRAGQSVAHLRYVYVYWWQESRRNDAVKSFERLFFEHNEAFLGQALSLERYLVSWAVDGQPKPLVDPSSVWSVEGIPGIEPTGFPLLRLGPSELDAFNNYKAPAAPY